MEKNYSYRESTSIYNPSFVIENEEKETVVVIYTDLFASDDVAESLAAKITDILNDGQTN